MHVLVTSGYHQEVGKHYEGSTLHALLILTVIIQSFKGLLIGVNTLLKAYVQLTEYEHRDGLHSDC